MITEVMDNKTYTREEVRQIKWDLLHELFLLVEKDQDDALKSAYVPGQSLNIEAEARASAYGNVLARIVGFQNSL